MPLKPTVRIYPEKGMFSFNCTVCGAIYERIGGGLIEHPKDGSFWRGAERCPFEGVRAMEPLSAVALEVV